MEQTKNEPTKENKAAPETGKPKKERLSLIHIFVAATILRSFFL